MALGIALGVLGLLVLALVVRVATEAGPTPGEVAVAYEQAWDRLDVATVWTLSSSEARDGLDRGEFVERKRRAFAGRQPLERLTGHVGVDAVIVEGPRAHVRTVLGLRSGGTIGSDITLERRDGRWQVVAYTLADASAEETLPIRWRSV